MVSDDTLAVIERAKQLYADRLQTSLESQHKDRFVAIEPESGDFFLADTFDEAVRSARAKHPSRLSHTIRIGHRAAFHMGGLGLANKPQPQFGSCQGKLLILAEDDEHLADFREYLP